MDHDLRMFWYLFWKQNENTKEASLQSFRRDLNAKLKHFSTFCETILPVIYMNLFTLTVCQQLSHFDCSFLRKNLSETTDTVITKMKYN